MFRYYALNPRKDSVHIFHAYLDLHRNNPALDIQMLPVSVMFGRSRAAKGTTVCRICVC